MIFIISSIKKRVVLDFNDTFTFLMIYLYERYVKSSFAFSWWVSHTACFIVLFGMLLFPVEERETHLISHNPKMSYRFKYIYIKLYKFITKVFLFLLIPNLCKKRILAIIITYFSYVSVEFMCSDWYLHFLSFLRTPELVDLAHQFCAS